MAESKSKPWEIDGEPGGSFGSWLRRQREVRDITLREIAQASKISIRYLQALEEDRFEVLPAPVFARGFLREYSRFVGLDPDEVVNYFLSAQPEGAGTETAETTIERRKPPYGLLVGSLIALLGIVALLSFLGEGRAGTVDQAPTIAAPAIDRNLVGDPVTVEESVAPIRLALDFFENSWVEAYVDGERSVSELRVQGESLRLEAEREIRLSLGNVAGVNLELNGEPFEPGVGDDETLRIDLASLELNRELGTDQR